MAVDETLQKVEAGGEDVSSVYHVNEDFLLREIAGECVLIPTGSGAEQFNGMIAVNSTFRFLWELFQTPSTIQEVLQVAKQAYSDESGALEQDIFRFVRECVQYGFLKAE